MVAYPPAGEIYAKRGDSVEAMEMLTRALVIREAKLGDAHPDTLLTREEMASIH